MMVEAPVNTRECSERRTMQGAGGQQVPSSGGEAARPAVCTEAQQWAAQELYEYIEVDTTDMAADAALQLDGGAPLRDALALTSCVPSSFSGAACITRSRIAPTISAALNLHS
jgi:hypothetical protein